MELLTEPVEPTINGMDGDGWSNSPAEPNAVHVNVYPEVAPPEEFVPGQTNSLAVTGVVATPKAVKATKVATKAVTADDAENK
jgi:hypothetical protein